MKKKTIIQLLLILVLIFSSFFFYSEYKKKNSDFEVLSEKKIDKDNENDSATSEFNILKNIKYISKDSSGNI